MGQILCPCTNRDKDKYKIENQLMKYSNDELEDKISEKIVNKNKNIGF